MWEGALEAGRKALSGPHGGSRLPSKDEVHSLPSRRECTLRRGGACALGEMGARERWGAGQKGLLWGKITPNPAQRCRRRLLSCSPNLASLPFPTHPPRKRRRKWAWGRGWLPASCLFPSGKGAQGPKAVLGPLSALGLWALLAFFFCYEAWGQGRPHWLLRGLLSHILQAFPPPPPGGFVHFYFPQILIQAPVCTELYTNHLKGTKESKGHNKASCLPSRVREPRGQLLFLRWSGGV